MFSIRMAQLSFFLLGVFTLFMGSVKVENDLPLGVAYFSMSIACTSVILAFHSIILGSESTRIAKESKDISIESNMISEKSIQISNESKRIACDSDEKMESLTNYHLLEIKGIIEDLRLKLQKHIKKITLMAHKGIDYSIEYDIYHSDYSYSMWKCYTYLHQIPAILKYSTPKYQIQIINYVHLYFDIVKKGRDNTKIELIPEHKDHIRMSYDIISKFPAFSQYKERKKLLEVMQDITS